MSNTAPTRGAVAASVSGITKRFGTVTALSGVDLEIRRGEIHALIGENGAGKSTLTRILAGLESPTEGEVTVGGQLIESFERQDMIARGVGLVQQHFTLVPTFTAEENIALSRPLGALRPSKAEQVRRLTGLSERYGLEVRPRIPVKDLSVGERQRVEILRALDAEAEILLLDEPTAVLVDAEAERLLELCRSFADEGRAVLIVTHRLAEVMQAADRVTVLRGGEVVLSTDQVDRYSREDLAREMIGDGSTGGYAPKPERRFDLAMKPVLEVEHVGLGRLADCTFDLRPGEIVGIAGVDGNGQAELESLLVGMAQPKRGSIRWTGRRIRPRHPRDLPKARIGYIPSDRHHSALAMPLTLSDNLELGTGHPLRPMRRVREAIANRALKAWDVRGGEAATRAAQLSGGNAQKVVLARELEGDPEVVIAAYPTRGLDPGAARTIADRLVSAVTERNAAAVWFGAELDELLAVADRIIVLVAGKPSTELAQPFSRQQIGQAMAGLDADGATEGEHPGV